ncbi:AfsR/SARP family transcriptional regulator [Salininema proteolyticum]|uniref:BTAD domain-containing putative transcriptional regulator n=1 Tax=Salininema proteolyticum TaxID=1607685 RepID=A0ABV8TV09_9ACTN
MITSDDLPRSRPSLEIKLFGPMQVAGDRVPLRLGGPRQKAVLAYLITCQGGLAAVDDIVEAVWGTDLPARPRHSVSVTTSRLRHALEWTGMRIDFDGGYFLERPLSTKVDWEEFDTLCARAETARYPQEAVDLLREALHLSSPTVLAGVEGPFAERMRRVWAGRLDDVREKLFALQLDAGRAREALAGLEEMVRSRPWRESARALHMMALAQEGRAAEAIDVFQSYARRMADEYGMDPSPVTREAYLKVISGRVPTRTPDGTTVLSPAR